MGNFPVNIHGSYGDEKVTSSVRIGNLPLGTRMMLPDGRIYAHASAGTVTAVGQLCIGADIASSAWVSDLNASAAVDSDFINITLTATGATTVDQFKDGYIFVNDDNGAGHVYKVASNLSAAVSTTCKFTLADNDTVQVLLKVASSEVGIKRNEFDSVVIRSGGTTVPNIPVGVTPVAITAGYYFWLQRRGVACVLMASTVGVAGAPMAADTATAGMQHLIVDANTSLTPSQSELGYCITSVGATTEYGLVYLTMD